MISAYFMTSVCPQKPSPRLVANYGERLRVTQARFYVDGRAHLRTFIVNTIH
jgi:hypothetical protein